MVGLRQKLEKITSNRLVRSVLVLTGGTALAQAVTILALPVLTRLYTPQEFGILAVFLAVFYMIAGISALRYEIAIPLPKSDSVAANVLGVALICVLATSLITLAAVTFLGKEISQLTNNTQLQPYLWLLPVTVFGAGCYNVFQYWATRKKNFKHIARTRLEQALAGVFLQIFLGWIGVGVVGLLFGQLAKVGIGSFGLARRAVLKSRAAFTKITPTSLSKAARSFDRYPKYSTFDTLANSAAIQLPIIFISIVSGNVEVGLLILAMKVMQTPMALLGTSIGQVYFSEATEEHRKGQLGEFTTKTLTNLAKIGVGPILFAGIIAPSVISFVFGPQWERTGVLMVWLTPWIMFQFLASPISMSMHVTGRQKTLLTLTLFGLALRIIFILYTVNLFTARYASEGYAVSGAVFYFICLMVFSIYSGLTKQNFISITVSAAPIIFAWVVFGVFADFILP